MNRYSVPVSSSTFFLVFWAVIALIIAVNLFVPRMRRVVECHRKLVFEMYGLTFFQRGISVGGGSVSRISVYEDALAIIFWMPQIVPFKDIEVVKLNDSVFPSVSIKIRKINIRVYGRRGSLDQLIKTINSGIKMHH